MTEFLLGVTAFFVSFLTLFTGFGLGTLLLPAFALFVPVEIAVASTAIVHGANNVFKVILLRRDADWGIVVRFGVPALVSAIAGAYLLGIVSSLAALAHWEIFGRQALVTPIKVLMAILIMGFAVVELVPSWRHSRVTPRMLPLGGLISGFFGGLSGHQGALRAAFFTPLELTPPAFAGTQAVLGLIVDIARLTVYTLTFLSPTADAAAPSMPVKLIFIAVAAAFIGAFLGKRLLPSVTSGAVRLITGILLILVALSLGAGIT